MRTLIRTLMTVATLMFVLGTLSFGADAGTDVFKTKCAMCHGADGKGETAMGKKFALKDLGSPDVQSLQDPVLNNLITNGKEKMPAYKEKLTADQIQDLVKYIRTFKK